MFNRYADPSIISQASNLRESVRMEWKRACESDGISPDSQFAVFSPDNPHAQAYNRAMEDYHLFRRAHTV